jgi:uncharacterized protein YndB with AHSA1/START domain
MVKNGSVRGVVADIPASPEAVFEVLADGWHYAAWVVGASHIREVDEGWPAEGTRIHHGIGPWPLLIEDSTQVLVCEPPRLLILDARMWPLGKARIRFDLRPRGRDTTVVRMTELVTRGPGVLMPVPVQTALIAPRNRETLKRLARLACKAHETA